jgi:TetR/AcrR family transcriptional regulator, transcriptional repressor for nem operon
VKAAQTRKLILEKAAPLFNQKGFEGTSMADLESATGLSKGALYGNFEDKESLAGEAFAWSTGTVRTLIGEELKGLISNKQKLCALFDFFSRYVSEPPIPGGCPLLNTAIEADDNRISMRPVVAGEIMRMVGFMEGLIRKGVRSGEFKKGTNARELAHIFFCAIEGAIMFSRVERSCDAMDIVVGHCKHKLDQISNPIWNKNA